MSGGEPSLSALLQQWHDSDLIELVQLARICRRAQQLHGVHALRVRAVDTIHSEDKAFALPVLELGAPGTTRPCVGFFAGVHGVERIGSQIVLYFLHTLIERLAWDSNLRALLERVTLVMMPVVNPVGVWRQRRSNGQGVDLMRNAPVEAEGAVPFLIGGHRLGRWLPWYRGPKNSPMQQEARALVQVVQENVMPHPFAITLDCHSGFGARDRIWFPYARSRQPIHHLPDMYALKNLWDSNYPFHHAYVIEPQAMQYMTHGDLWDYIYMQSLAQSQHTLLPLTLEMGSWLWVKKNPRQLFSMLGAFHPLVSHRFQRVLRQHIPLFEFILRAACEYRYWLPEGNKREQVRRVARAYWGL